MSYASFLRSTHNRSVHLDIGIALGSGHGHVQSELDLEVLLGELGRLRSEQGGDLIRNFAVFENSGYEAMAKTDPCPPTDTKACGPPSTRPTRSVWWYNLLHAAGSVPPHAVNMVLNASAQQQIISWCKARHITELYIDQWSSTDPAIQKSFEQFVTRSDKAGIDLQLYVGEVEDARQAGVPVTVLKVAAWCQSKPELCGQRLSTTPHFLGGYVYRTRQAAATACSGRGMSLCRKAELVGHSMCEAGWTADWEGYWMTTASKGCGRKGFNPHQGPAGAWCCQS